MQYREQTFPLKPTFPHLERVVFGGNSVPPPANSGSKQHDDATRTVFLGGLPLTSTREKIVSYLKKFGELERIVLPRDPVSKRIKGYGKAIYKDSRAAQQALEFQGHSLKGVAFGVMPWLGVSDYENMRANLSSRKVYVKHRPQHTKEVLLAYFEQFGHVEAIDMRLSFSSNKPRNFCYVVFESPHSALQVVNQPEHLLGGLPLLCEMCKPNKKQTDHENQGLAGPYMSLSDPHPSQVSPSTDGIVWTTSAKDHRPESSLLQLSRTRLEGGFHDLPEDFSLSLQNKKAKSDLSTVAFSRSQAYGSSVGNLLEGKHADGEGPGEGSLKKGRISQVRKASQESEAVLDLVPSHQVWKPTSLRYPRATLALINERHRPGNDIISFSLARPRCV